MSIKSLIRIADKLITAYENVKKKIKEFMRRRKSRQIRKMVDEHNVDDVADIVQLIKRKKADRNDSS